MPNTMLRTLRSRDSPASAFAEKEDDFGRDRLWVSVHDNDLFRSGRRYEFQLRSQYYKNIGGNDRAVGETRSGPRLGVVDFKGPRIISWKTTQHLNKPTRGFPICSLIFDERIDCSHPSLAAVVTGSGGMSKQGDVYCTSRLQQLNAMLPLISQEDVDLWSGTEIGVSIHAFPSPGFCNFWRALDATYFKVS